MTPKQKAINLFNNYVKLLPIGSNVERAKQCTLIAVDEILEILDKMDWTFTDKKADYFREVKQEINNL